MMRDPTQFGVNKLYLFLQTTLGLTWLTPSDKVKSRLRNCFCRANWFKEADGSDPGDSMNSMGVKQLDSSKEVLMFRLDRLAYWHPILS